MPFSFGLVARHGLRRHGGEIRKLHGNVWRAVIGLAGFANGDDAYVMNAARGSRFIYVAAALRRHMAR